jgi:hypothetical protein
MGATCMKTTVYWKTKDTHIIAKRDSMELEKKESKWKKTALTYEQWRELHKNDKELESNE